MPMIFQIPFLSLFIHKVLLRYLPNIIPLVTSRPPSPPLAWLRPLFFLLCHVTIHLYFLVTTKDQKIKPIVLSMTLVIVSTLSLLSVLLLVFSHYGEPLVKVLCSIEVICDVCPLTFPGGRPPLERPPIPSYFRLCLPHRCPNLGSEK